MKSNDVKKIIKSVNWIKFMNCLPKWSVTCAKFVEMKDKSERKSFSFMMPP